MYFDILENNCRYQNNKDYYPVLGFWQWGGVDALSLKDIRLNDTPTPTRILGQVRKEVALREVSVFHTV